MSISGHSRVGIAVVLAAALAIAACGDDSGGSGDAARFCELTDEVDALADPASPDDVPAWLSDLQELFNEAAAVAPAEIRDDLRLTVDAVNEVEPEQIIAGETLTTTPEMVEADDRVMAWTAENC